MALLPPSSTPIGNWEADMFRHRVQTPIGNWEADMCLSALQRRVQEPIG